MSKKLIFPVILGVGGVAILLWLGFWQLQRLEWKTAILDEIEAKINAPATQVPFAPNKEEHNRVSVQGEFLVEDGEIHVLTSDHLQGPGFLLIKPAYELRQKRRFLIDFGFIPEAEKNTPRENQRVRVLGNLLWPNEVDSFTPEPNFERNIWFARDLEKMAATLKTDPILIVARDYMGDPMGTTPVVMGHNVSNDHREYAITWFSLAAIWLFMTGYLIHRIRQKTV